MLDLTQRKRIEEAKESLKVVCNKYVWLLAEKWNRDEKEAYWVGDELGGLCDFDGDFTITLTDMVYVVENDVSYAEYMEWMNYNIDAHKWGFNNINLKSWHMGAPRVSNDVFVHLQDLKNVVDNAINEHVVDIDSAEEFAKKHPNVKLIPKKDLNNRRKQ